MTIFNASEVAIHVEVNTFVYPASSVQSSESPKHQTASENQSGWHEIAVLNDVKATSQVLGTNVGKSSRSHESVAPFIWSGSSATSVRVEPMSISEIPMKLCVFSPGIYNLSNYALNWKFLPVSEENDDQTRQSSGTCRGYPYYLTVLQSAEI